MKRILRLVFGLSLWIALILSVIHISSLDFSFYENQYRKIGVAKDIGVSDEDLMSSTHVLLDYLQGKEADLWNTPVTIGGQQENMFNQREIDHMVDVQVLFVSTIVIRNAAFGLLVMTALYFIIRARQNALQELASGLVEASLLMGIVLGFIVIFAMLDFSQFWVYFHHILFRNDLWLLNPATDNLILMVPLAFFNSLVVLILVRIALAVIWIGSLLYGIFKKGYSRRSLKFLALLFMTLDHIGVFLLPELVELRIIGRLAFPVFSYLFVDSFERTNDLRKFLFRLFAFAVITQLLWYAAGIEIINIFFLYTMALAAFIGIRTEKFYIVLVMGLLAELFNVDYGLFGISLMSMWFYTRENSKSQLWVFIFMVLAFFGLPGILIFLIEGDWSGLIQPLAVLALPYIAHYQPSYTPVQRQNSPIEKYFFYLYYPLHVVLLAFLGGLG